MITGNQKERGFNGIQKTASFNEFMTTRSLSQVTSENCQVNLVFSCRDELDKVSENMILDPSEVKV